MDHVADKSGVASDSSAADLLKKADADGDGSLSASELGQAMHDLMPPPSTMDFAQSRAGDGAAQSSDDMFAKLDTDGDGKLSQTEFDAGKPSGPDGGMPPPPPAGASAAGDDTTYDPLDTNQDGIVSDAERAAGEATGTSSTTTTQALDALFKAVDTDGDNKISADETRLLFRNVAAALQSIDSESASPGKAGSKPERIDLGTLADLVRKQYEQVAAGESAQSSSGTTVNTVA
jgi:Ca2+-binding EF-hand superfamily protein